MNAIRQLLAASITEKPAWGPASLSSVPQMEKKESHT